MRHGQASGSAVCGLRVRPASDWDDARWQDQVGELLYPTTRSSATWSADSWELFREAGYFNIHGRSAAHFGLLREAFANVSRRLDTFPDLGVQVVWPSERGIEGSVSLLRICGGAWLGYQLASRSRSARPEVAAPARSVLRDINLRAYGNLANHPEFDWFIQYVPDNVPWSKWAYRDFPLRYEDSGLASVTTFQALQAECGETRSSRPYGCDVGPPSDEELARLLARIAATRPAPYVESLDLIHSRLDLAAARAVWDRAGFTRERGVLIARRDGRAVAGAILDLAEEGLHLFGLLDTVRLFALDEPDDLAFAALLEAARGWYWARGKRAYAYFREDPTGEHVERVGLTDLGTAYLTIISAELLPDFLDHIYEITGASGASS